MLRPLQPCSGAQPRARPRWDDANAICVACGGMPVISIRQRYAARHPRPVRDPAATFGAMLLLLDFDGTLTDHDTLDLLVAEHAPAVWLEAEQALTDGTMTLNEVIAVEFGHVHTTLDEALAVLRERVALRPGLDELIEFCRERFIEPVVVSSGFHEVIEPMLAWAGVKLPVVAHSAAFSRDGTTVTFLERATCLTCGEPCKRMELERL